MATGITHFTSQMAAAAILNGWRKDLHVPGKGPQEVRLRLYSRWGTNDPHEQRMAAYGMDRTDQKHPQGATPQSRHAFPDDVFMLCGSKPQGGEKGEATDRLEMWRAYGDDGRGVAFTLWWNVERLREENLEIMEVKYISDMNEITRKAKRLYRNQIDRRRKPHKRDEIRMQRMRLEAGHKHLDYKAENEVRLVRFLGDKTGETRGSGPDEMHLDAASGRLRTYIERPVRLGTTLTKLDITLGPRMMPGDVQHWENVGQWMLARMGLSGGRVQQSELAYIG